MSKRKSRTWVARTTLLWTALGFVLLQVALAISIELAFPEFRDPVYGHKIARLQQRTIRAESRPLTVVMLGSSRTVCGFKASAIERPLAAALGRPTVVFNFGINGAGPVLQLLNLKRVVADGIRPDLLLVEVMPPLLAGQVPLYELDESVLPTDRLGLRDLPLVRRYAGAIRPNLDRNWWRESLVPWFSHRFSILNDLATNCLSEKAQIEGFRGMDACGCVNIDWDDVSAAKCEAARQGMRTRYAPFLEGFRLGDAPCQGLCELLETCRRERIPAAIVIMPEGPAFRSWYSADAWHEIQRFVDDVCGRFDVPLINAREWLPEEDFADSHHHLPRGAAAFTARLCREGVLPLLQQSSAPYGGSAPLARKDATGKSG